VASFIFKIPLRAGLSKTPEIKKKRRIFVSLLIKNLEPSSKSFKRAITGDSRLLKSGLEPTKRA
jgi:hypothetical protein